LRSWGPNTFSRIAKYLAGKGDDLGLSPRHHEIAKADPRRIFGNAEYLTATDVIAERRQPARLHGHKQDEAGPVLSRLPQRCMAFQRRIGRLQIFVRDYAEHAVRRLVAQFHPGVDVVAPFDLPLMDMRRVAERLQLLGAFAVFHILGPSIASLEEIAETANFMHGAKYFLVKNFINNTSFFEWDHATYNSYFRRIKDATELTIPKLDEMAYEQVEVASVPFLKFVANKDVNDKDANYSFALRGYVRHWLTNVWSEFDRIKLTDIVGSKEKSSRNSGEKITVPQLGL
jgi:hypothetical protein